MAPFYPKAMTGQLPPTPPHSGPYEYQPCHPSQYQDNFMPSQPLRLESAIEFTHRYGQQALPQPNFNSRWTGQQVLPPINPYYEARAPILPPLRVQAGFYADRDFYQQQYPQTSTDQVGPSQQPPQKEEQPTGGVSATLDYEMEKMADFVAEVAQDIILPGTSSPSFRKWVFQVLSATRLPSATILLSLHYLTVRLSKFPSSIERTDNQLYRLLAVSMILGSKFLDDNTFINRSWSDVTGIKVVELNNLEIKWLALIGFDLHTDPTDPNGVALWIRAWKEHDARAYSPKRSANLSPLNTDLSSHKSNKSNRNSFQNGLRQTAHGTFTPLTSGSANSASGTPYLSADPWNRSHHTPQEFFPTQGRFSSTEDVHHFGPSTGNSRMCAPQYPQFSLPPLQPPVHYNPWNQPWESYHGYGCHCGGCARNASASHAVGSHFHQTVVG